jgi:hypothetical protein
MNGARLGSMQQLLLGSPFFMALPEVADKFSTLGSVPLKQHAAVSHNGQLSAQVL